MGVFLSINSAINLDAVAKNRHSLWIGNKVSVNVDLTISYLDDTINCILLPYTLVVMVMYASYDVISYPI